jgi:hypothetical protein
MNVKLNSSLFAPPQSVTVCLHPLHIITTHIYITHPIYQNLPHTTTLLGLLYPEDEDYELLTPVTKVSHPRRGDFSVVYLSGCSLPPRETIVKPGTDSMLQTSEHHFSISYSQ